MSTLDRIKALCEEKNITLTSLCLQATGNKGNLTTWKNNDGIMRSDYLAKCAVILDCTSDYLLGLETKAESLVRTTIRKSQIENDIKADEMTEMLSIASKLDDDALKFLSIMFGMSADERKSIMATAEKLAKK